MSYFEGIDKYGFLEDQFFGDYTTVSSVVNVNSDSGIIRSLMGGPNTGIDDAAGIALSGIGATMLFPGPTYAAAAVAGGRIAGPVGAAAGVVAYAAAGLAVMGLGQGLRSLD